jgi:hypothetical protein
MRILLGHVVHSPGTAEWYGDIAATAPEGFDVRTFCVTLDPPGPRLSWRELDSRWRRRDKVLMDLYARLQEAASDCDVFLLYNGVNVHPGFLERLTTVNVYSCFDDPESSADQSAPVAAAFDAVFYGNVASRFQYEGWGCKKLAWLPIFTAPGDVPSQEEGERLLSGERAVDISLVCDNNVYRTHRLNALARSFPQAKCFGRGWKDGTIGDQALHELYRSTKIGWNVHNSTGPINRRLFALPAFGVLQICDNRTGLGMIFELGKEVVGFDTIPEAIALTRHYLEHDVERREIVAHGWRRYWKEYHARAIWQRIGEQLDIWMAEEGGKERKSQSGLHSKRPPAVTLAPWDRIPRGLVRRFSAAGRQLLPDREPDDPPWVPRKVDERVCLEEPVPAYVENPGMEGVNMARERLAVGEPFEWPNMLALNWAVTSLIRDAKKIVEIGSGTGPFAWFASVAPDRAIHCFENDDFARSWAERHRSRTNIAYFSSYDGNLRERYDLLVSIDVIEHVADVRDFLLFCSRLAPRAIFTTPNREIVRGPGDLGPPGYLAHVREFDPGEFYWLLRQYYGHVALYFTPDVNVPWLEPMTILTKGTPIVAECRGPLSRGERPAPPGPPGENQVGGLLGSTGAYRKP